MRISDWSSDVCSSDLVERSACPDQRGVATVQGPGKGGGVAAGVPLRSPASYKLRQFLACHRAGAEEALIKIAAAAGEECKLLLAFHALGNDIQSQRFRHVDNAAHDDAVPFRTCNVLGKAAVDLEIIERQGFQIGETGIARTEIVYGDTQPRLPPLGE